MFKLQIYQDHERILLLVQLKRDHIFFFFFFEAPFYPQNMFLLF